MSSQHHSRSFLAPRSLLAFALIWGACQASASPASQMLSRREGRGPIVETLSTGSRVRSGIALGGLGTGSVELRKDGQFYNWTIFNNQPLSTGPAFAFATHPNNGAMESVQFFLVRYQEEGGDVRLKLLQLNDSVNEGAMTGITYYYPWMTAVETIEYSGRFPFINTRFSDPEMPFDIHLEAFTPFIPHDVKNSALPGAYFNFKVVAKGNKAVKVMLIATQRNSVGYDTTDKYFTAQVNRGPGYLSVDQSAGMDPKASSYGQMGLVSLSEDSSYYAGWEHKHPYYERLLFEERLPNLNVTANRNKTNPETSARYATMGRGNKDQRAFSSVAVSRALSPGSSFSHSFAMTWFFPNNYGSHNSVKKDDKPKKWVRDFEGPYSYEQVQTKDQGRYYERFFSSSAEVAAYLVEQKHDLSARSHSFVDDFYNSSAELFVLDQINSHLNTFVTSSTFTEAGKFGIREGLSPDRSWGPNNTIDVSLYGSSAVINLFPELQKSSMRAHRDLQSKQGEINHGLGYDLDYTQNGTWGVYHRVDMPANYIQLVLRDFFHTNDRAYLKEMWPSLKKAIDYVLSERDADEDRMPDMKGIMCSYDNFPMYGLSSYIQSQWLAALKSMTIAAEVMRDEEAMALYEDIYRAGSELMDEHLWNGAYYILSRDYSGLAKDVDGSRDRDEGCLTDQVIGQWIAHQSSLGYLLDKGRVKKALASVMDMSFKKGFGLRNASWPQYPGLFPIHESNLWVDQANTTWTGVELAFASFLIYEDMYADGLKVIKAVDDRYREAGLYWDHQEFGGHYYRPMSAWQIVNALLGLGVNQDHYSFDPKLPHGDYQLFFAFDGGTAHYGKQGESVTIRVRTGVFTPRSLRIVGLPGLSSVSVDGREIDAVVADSGDARLVALPAGFKLEMGQSISLR